MMKPGTATIRIALLAYAIGLSACARLNDVHQQSDGSYTIESEDGNGLTGFSGLLEMNRRQARRFCQDHGQILVEGQERHEGAMFIMGTASELAFSCIPKAGS